MRAGKCLCMCMHVIVCVCDLTVHLDSNLLVKHLLFGSSISAYTHAYVATHTGRHTHRYTHTNQQASVKTVVRDVIMCSFYKSSIGGSGCLSTFELLSVVVGVSV